MDDRIIIEQLWERSETALALLEQAYSPLYRSILHSVLGDDCDIEESANDLLLAVWNSIPPNRPDSLPAYICKLARRIGIDRFRNSTRQKRSSGYTVALSELEECLPDREPADEYASQSALIRDVLNEFLHSLDPETQILFIRRYVYLETLTDLALRFEMKENRISARLYRAKKKLKQMLEKEGISL